MPSLAELLRTNPRGWGTAPPAQQYQGDITSGNSADADYFGEQYGPEAGALVQKLLNAGQVGRGVARGLTGIEMAEQGGENLAGAVGRGDALGGAGAMAQMGLAAIPAAGRLAEPLFASAPRMAAILGTYGAAPGMAAGAFSPTDAMAASKKKKAAAEPELAPTIIEGMPDDDGLNETQRARATKLRSDLSKSRFANGSERRSIEEELKGLTSLGMSNLSGKNAADAEAKKIEATARAQREADAAAKAQSEADRKREANTSVKELYPTINALVPASTGVLAGLLGGKIKGSYVKSFQGKADDLAKEWGSVAKKADEALASGDTLTASKLASEAEGMKTQFSDLLKAGVGGTWPAVGAGAGIGELGQLGPVGIDKARAIPGSELEQHVNDQMSDPYAVGGRVLQGALWGGIPAKIGATVAGSKVNAPLGAGPKTESLSTLLKEGGLDQARRAQGELAGYESSRASRLNASDVAGRRNQQAESGAQRLQGPPASGGTSLSSQLSNYKSHNGWEAQTRNNGKFGPKSKTPDNDK